MLINDKKKKKEFDREKEEDKLAKQLLKHIDFGKFCPSFADYRG